MALSFDNKWTVRESLSEGGQAHTFLVDRVGDETGGRFVLKRLKNRNRISRFRNEIRAGLLLEHRNIVQILDSNLDAPEPYIVTPFYSAGELRPNHIHGKTLLERLRFFLDICEGGGVRA